MITQITDEMTSLLEESQLARTKARPLPRRHLSKPVLALLILLRIYVVLALPLVAYAFIQALMK